MNQRERIYVYFGVFRAKLQSVTICYMCNLNLLCTQDLAFAIYRCIQLRRTYIEQIYITNNRGMVTVDGIYAISFKVAHYYCENGLFALHAESME